MMLEIKRLAAHAAQLRHPKRRFGSCRAGWQVRQDERPYEVDFDENDNRTRSGGRSRAMPDIWTTNVEQPTGSAASGRGLS